MNNKISISVIELILLYLLLMTPFSFAQENRIRDILILQDQRSLGDQHQLVNSLNDKDKDIITSSIIALANIQDTNVIKNLEVLLFSGNDEISAIAAFALGQLGPNIDAERLLQNKLSECKSILVLTKLFEALGKVGGESSLNSILSIETNTDTLLYEKILSFARFALRKISNKETVKFIIDNIKHHNNKIRSICAFALWRIGNQKLLEKYSKEILELMNDKDEYARMWAVNILLNLKVEKSFEKPLFDRLSDNDWKVQINTLKVLEKYVLPENKLASILNKIDDANEHISVTALRYLRKAKFFPDLSISKRYNKLISIISNDGKIYSSQQQGEAAITLANLVVDPKDAIKYIMPLLKTDNIRLQSKAVIALADTKSQFALDFLLDSIKTTNPLVNTNRVESISKLFKAVKFTPLDLKKTKILFSSLLSENDLAVVTTIASVLKDSVFRNLISEDVLIRTFNKMSTPNDIEPMVEILNTLGYSKSAGVIEFLKGCLNNDEKEIVKAAAKSLKQITKTDYIQKIPLNSRIKNSDYDWAYLDNISNKPEVMIKTQKGNIKIHLFVKEAPLTVISFCKLIDKGFYNNLLFHRVVPNFVIQGGDPRGDGWGGPGYSIRTEISFRIFERGMVGIASSGKDTEGCQFFITHSPQPHLDGRYTIFAEVVEGMDVVDKIQEGDKIIEMTHY